MGELDELIENSFDAMLAIREANKYKVSFGYFQAYTNPTPQSDSEGKRFCDLKLYAKDPDTNDVSCLGVPLAYFGNKNGMNDFKLQPGDELIVLFSDRSLAQWKEESGTEPQSLTDPVRDSKNHAIAIPVVTTHYASEVITVPVDDNALGVRVRPGKKIEIGDGTNEVLNLKNDFLGVMKDFLTDFKALDSSSGDNFATAFTNFKTTMDAAYITPIDNIITALANIKV